MIACSDEVHHTPNAPQISYCMKCMQYKVVLSYFQCISIFFIVVLSIDSLFAPADIEEFTKVEDDGHCYGWLEEIEMPQEAEMDGIPYLGPPIDEYNS